MSIWHRSTIALLAGLLTACMIVRAPSKEELFALNHPPETISQKVNILAPKVLAWFDELELTWAMQTRALNDKELERARLVGVRQPERIRVAISDTLPLPTDPELLWAAKNYGLGAKSEGGRTHGYLIILKPDSLKYPEIMQHEFVHVSQYESLGRQAFVQRYLIELEMLGYARSPLELQAYAKQNLK